jgi:uncharacterized protein (TIGR02453 family)
MATFAGFSDRALEFYAGLERDSSKAYWTKHKPTYDTEVAAPMRALVQDLDPEFGPGKVFRPYRDVRFSLDKSPYKTHQGAFLGPVLGVGYYVQVDAAGLLVGGGFRAHSPAQVDRYRQAVDADASGAALVTLIDRLKQQGMVIEGARLKTRPRGFPADHPRMDLLRYQELMVLDHCGRPDWLASAAALDEIAAIWRRITPLNDWVMRYVGPS